MQTIEDESTTMQRHNPNRIILFAGAVAFVLGACGKSDNHTVSQNAAAGKPAPASVKRQPGSWSIVHYVAAFDATGVQGGLIDMVAAGQASIGKREVAGPVCVTADQVRKDDLAVRIAEAIQLGPEWTVIRSEIKGGEVDFLARMDDAKVGTATVNVTGTVSATATNLTVVTDAQQPKPGKGHIHTVMKQENVRLADCAV